MKTDFRTYVAKLPLSSVWRGPLGERFVGIVLAAIHDVMAERFTEATQTPYMHLVGATPDDALPLIGSETSIDAYAGEQLSAYRARLTDPWGTWTPAGDEDVITAQFAAAGYPGVSVVLDTAALGPRGEAAPYWSQFWLYFPYSSGHPVTANGKTWNGFNWGDGTVYGLNVTVAFYALLHSITRKWKPGHWVCRGFKFQLADTSIVEIGFEG